MENSTSVDDVIAKAEGYRLDKWAELQLELIRGEIKVEDFISNIKAMLEDI